MTDDILTDEQLTIIREQAEHGEKHPSTNMLKMLLRHCDAVDAFYSALMDVPGIEKKG